MSARLRLRLSDGRIYLDRWGIESIRLGGIFIHKMSAPDPGPHLHNHPWWFGSLILWGGYYEQRTTEDEILSQGVIPRTGSLYSVRQVRNWLSWKSFPLNECHRIENLKRNTSWSLVVHGPTKRGWGFFLPNGSTGSSYWVPWRVYEASDVGRARNMEAVISPSFDAED